MQKLLLLLTVIISRAVPSPISQVGPVDSFDIALPDFSDSGIDASGIDAPVTFQLASSETSPQEAPAQAPQNIPQPGDPVLKPAPQSKPQIAPPVNSKQPFSCEAGKSGACCIGVTRDGVTSGCISCTFFINKILPRDAILSLSHTHTHSLTHTKKKKKKKKKIDYGYEYAPLYV